MMLTIYKLGCWVLKSKFVLSPIKCYLLHSSLSSFDSAILCIIYYLLFCVIWNLISMPSLSSKQLLKSVRMCILVARIIKTPTAVNYSLHAFLPEQWRTVFRKMDFIEPNIFTNSFSQQILVFIENSQNINTMLCTSESYKKHKNMILDLDELTISLEKQDIQNWSYDMIRGRDNQMLQEVEGKRDHCGRWEWNRTAWRQLDFI